MTREEEIIDEKKFEIYQIWCKHFNTCGYQNEGYTTLQDFKDYAIVPLARKLCVEPIDLLFDKLLFDKLWSSFEGIRYADVFWIGADDLIKSGSHSQFLKEHADVFDVTAENICKYCEQDKEFMNEISEKLKIIADLQNNN